MDFNITNIVVAKGIHDTSVVDYTETPREQNLLHLVLDGERVYDTDGKRFLVKKNTALFIPDKTRYKTKALVKCPGIGIRFDADIFNDPKDLDVYYKCDVSEKLISMFEKVVSIYDTRPCEMLELKNSVSRLLSEFIKSEIPEEYAILKDAVAFINEHYRENLPVKAYADKCNLSESYFRKKFREFFAKSPVEYRNELRFAEAKRLYQQNYSTQKIAELLGFCDAGYMLKLYRQYTKRTLKSDSEII